MYLKGDTAAQQIRIRSANVQAVVFLTPNLRNRT
jgi:hypothetical protein